MLNNDTLSQLAKLKQDIHSSKDYGNGRVVGSNGRFGFAKLDDGRDIYLSPDNMQRLIPGDIIKVSVESKKGGKNEGKLEKLITPALNRFVGRYRIKGKAHFVEPDGAQASKWLFLPPKARGKTCAEGDYVLAKLTNHPWQDGKASAKILDKLGKGDENQFEHNFIRAKFGLSYFNDDETKKQISDIDDRFGKNDFPSIGDRKDLSETPFFTIDAETTMDMDDALFAEKNDNGNYTLQVAIADPSHAIGQESALSKRAFILSQSSYLLGGTLPMMPNNISHHCFSLEADKTRPALVASIEIDSEGGIVSSNFEFALIKSHHKLSYDQVAKQLDADNDETNIVPESCTAALETLKNLAQLRRKYREANNIVNKDQPDYRVELNERGHIHEIQPQPRTIAHQLVEEAMVATNVCAANVLAENKLGIFSTHKGFREDRLGEVKALLKEENIEHEDLQTLEGFVKLFHSLECDEKSKHLGAPLRRMLDAAELSSEAQAHMGMGLTVYATVTSPIRRYVDLYNHWALQHILEKQKMRTINDHRLESLREKVQNGRKADRELTLWLNSIFIESYIGKELEGTVRIVTQQGFGLKLDDIGVEGFVLFPKEKEKQYDAKRMTLTVDEVRYALDDTVKVKIASIDKEKRRVALELAV
ncbi:MAG: VacB/RNase II family 3'-5' exoribonuclease [Agarilytica sp.]